MKNLILALALFAGAAQAANLISETQLPNGKTVCLYDDGTSYVTSTNNCRSFK